MGRYAFVIPAEKRDEIAAWVKEQDLQACFLQIYHQKFPDYVVEKIEESIKKGDPKPYCKHIQGKLTYSFTPTALGDVTTIKHNITGKEIDITPYDFW